MFTTISHLISAAAIDTMKNNLLKRCPKAAWGGCRHEENDCACSRCLAAQELQTLEWSQQGHLVDYMQEMGLTFENAMGVLYVYDEADIANIQ